MVSGCEVHLRRPIPTSKAPSIAPWLVGGPWGILDLESSTWMGNNDGPFVFEDFDAARAKRQLLARRFLVRPSDSVLNRLCRHQGSWTTISLQNTVDQAMELIEQRGY